MTDTIFALSSGQPPAAIAVIRISGPDAFAAVEALAGKLPPPRRASLRTLRHDGEMLDHALVVTFAAPATATGEDLVELHVHGGRAVIRAVETTLGAIAGLRLAEPGEFTRRALANGRIGLTEAEGLADLLAAETEGQRRAAARAAEGGIRRLVEGWAARTLHLSAAAEALLDHADEDDVAGQGDAADIAIAAATLAREIATTVAQPGVERLRDGLRVVLAGPPNAGKSTLLNALAGRDAAIVSPVAGTTRDRIEVPVMRDGIAYLLIDTAGLHASPADLVEQIGIERSHEALADADIILWLDDAPPPEADAILLHARADLPDRSVASGRLPVSAMTGAGMAELWSAIGDHAARLLPPVDAMPLNQRQRDLSAMAGEALQSAAYEDDIVLQAEQLRRALRAFHQITGAADVEAMLDSLFGRFCIGK